MKLKSEQFGSIVPIIGKIDMSMVGNGASIFFPTEKEAAVDEFGIASTQLKTETRFGSSLSAGVIKIEGEKPYLAYAPEGSLFSFDLGYYLRITRQTRLAADEIELLSQFETGLVLTKDAIIFGTPLKGVCV